MIYSGQLFNTVLKHLLTVLIKSIIINIHILSDKILSKIHITLWTSYYNNRFNFLCFRISIVLRTSSNKLKEVKEYFHNIYINLDSSKDVLFGTQSHSPASDNCLSIEHQKLWNKYSCLVQFYSKQRCKYFIKQGAITPL